jgi:hypothetical protein
MSFLNLSVYNRREFDRIIRMMNRKGLLNRLLRMLVDEWGYEQVAEELRRTDRVPDGSDQLRIPSTARSPKQKTILSPSEQVEKALLDPTRKQLLLQIARRYEQKQFLPSVAAVTEFLTMMGDDPGQLKDRVQAFRVLLRALLQLSADRLTQLTNSSLHSGPSQLGPISAAIAAAGEHLPRRSQEPTSTKESKYNEEKIPNPER